MPVPSPALYIVGDFLGLGYPMPDFSSLAFRVIELIYPIYGFCLLTSCWVGFILLLVVLSHWSLNRHFGEYPPIKEKYVPAPRQPQIFHIVPPVKIKLPAKTVAIAGFSAVMLFTGTSFGLYLAGLDGNDLLTTLVRTAVSGCLSIGLFFTILIAWLVRQHKKQG